MLIAFHKPYGVVSQFTPETPGQRTLAEFGFPKGVYSIGRLDADSEGLLLLGDEPSWNERLLDPRHAHAREYWAQVERIPTTFSLEQLAHGMIVRGKWTLPCHAWILDPQPVVLEGDQTTIPGRTNETAAGIMLAHRSAAAVPRLLPRNPPIRFRKTVPTCWIGLELIEGKNRQVRRMTAAIGHPTLRLLRVRIGLYWLGDLSAGQWRVLDKAERRTVGQNPMSCAIERHN